MKKNALILGGGGSRGAYQIGVWKALTEEDWPIDIVCGTSVGALNSALIAQGDYPLAEYLWLSLRTKDVLAVEVDEEAAEYKQIFQAFQNYLKGGPPLIGDIGLDTAGLRELMVNHLDEEKIRASGKQMGLVTVKWGDGPTLVPRVMFLEDIPQGRLFDYLMGSASLYPAMKSYLIDGDKYIDGGYHDALPINMGFEAGAGFVLAVDINGPGRLHMPNLRPDQDLMVVGSPWPLGPMLLFENHWIARNMRLGYLDAKKAFGHYYGCFFTFMAQHFPLIGHKRAACNGIAALLDQGGRVETIYHNAFDRWARKKYQGRYHWRRDLMMIMAEAAGEVFEADPLQIYDAAAFCGEICRCLGALAGEESRGEPVHSENIEKAVSRLHPQGRALYFRRALAEGAGGGRFGRVASLFLREFLAGAFLYVQELISEEQIGDTK